MGWGLEIEPDIVRACCSELRRGRFRLRRRMEVPVPSGLIRPSLKDGNVQDMAALSKLFRDLAKKAGCEGWVRVVLPDPVFILRSVATNDLPPKPREAWRFLRWQARDLLPFPSEEARLDYLPLGRGSDGRLRTVFLAARDRILAEYERALTDADLRPALLDARTIALAQAASDILGEGTAGLLAVGRGWTTLLVVQEGQPRFWRLLRNGSDGWIGAERPRLLREVSDSLTFCLESEQVGPLGGMTLTGLGEGTAEVASALTEWLGVPVTGLDLRAALRSQESPDDLDVWGPAIGAAIRPC